MMHFVGKSIAYQWYSINKLLQGKHENWKVSTGEGGGICSDIKTENAFNTKTFMFVGTLKNTK